jgi:flagellar biosynthesis/type III secretory pathway chaperone
MTDEVTDMQVDALNDLLDAERTALLAGDLDKLTEMFDSKEALIEVMNQTPQRDLECLQMLDTKVKRNQLLLNGAMEGIRNVAKRMAELRQIRRSLETYGADGKKHTIDVSNDASVEKRA